MNTAKNLNTSSLLSPKLYRFECETPITSEQIVRDQMQLATIYFQTLLDIEKERKIAYRKADPIFAEMSDREANILLVSMEIQELQSMIGKEHATVSNEQILNRIQLLRTSLRDQKNALKEIKAFVRNNRQLQVKATQIDQQAREKVKFARKNSGVYWGTYLMVESSVSKRESVASSYPPAEEIPSKRPPSLISINRKKDSEGRIGIKLATPISVDEAFQGNDSRFRLENTTSGIHAWVRVGSAEDNMRHPLWAIFPLTQFKLNNDVLIESANVTNVVREGRETWFLDLWVLEQTRAPISSGVTELRPKTLQPQHHVEIPRAVRRVAESVVRFLPSWIVRVHREED